MQLKWNKIKIFKQLIQKNKKAKTNILIQILSLFISLISNYFNNCNINNAK